MARPISLCLVACCVCLPLACSSKLDPVDQATTATLMKVFDAYRMYYEQKNQTPPNEQAFKDFIAKLPKEKREELKVGADVDRFLTSPRDGKKYVIRYGVPFDRTGDTRALAWEVDGRNGQKMVGLSNGYVQEYSETDFKELQK